MLPQHWQKYRHSFHHILGKNCRLAAKSSHLSSKTAKSYCDLCPQEQWAVLRALQQLKFIAPTAGKVCVDINSLTWVNETGRFSYLG